MRFIQTKHTLLAVAAVALLGAGCAEDEGLGEGGAFEDEGAFEEQGALEDEGIGNDAIGDEGLGDEGVADEGVGEPGIGGAAGEGDGIDVAEGPGQQPAEGDVVSTYPPFEEVDTNADGMLDRQELASVEGVDFASLDTDQDDTVTREEYEAARTQ